MVDFFDNSANQSYFNFYYYLNNSVKSPVWRDYVLVSTSEDRAVTVAQVKEHLKLNPNNVEADTYYEMLIDAATMVAEYMMRKELINKVFHTYFDGWWDREDGAILKKRPLVSVDSVSYLNEDNEWVAVASENYYATTSTGYSRLFFDPDYPLPTITNRRQQRVRVAFTSGSGTGESLSIPADVQLALLNHIAVLHEQRGDWGSADLGISELISSVPTVSKAVYSKYRLTNGGR